MHIWLGMRVILALSIMFAGTYVSCLKIFNSSLWQEMGGYFIINGIEKVIRMLIMPRRNFPIAMVRPKWKSRGPGYTQYGKLQGCLECSFRNIKAVLLKVDVCT